MTIENLDLSSAPQSDWDETDETSPRFIRNRPANAGGADDFTSEERAKLQGIENEATRDQTKQEILDLVGDASTSSKGFMTVAFVNKLRQIEAGATQDQTATEIVDLLKTLTGSNRLPGSAVDGISTSFSELTGKATDSQLPDEITRDSELAAALVSRWTDRGTYDQANSYAKNDIVRHTVNDAEAAYLALQAVPARSMQTAEPDAGSSWETFWYRIAYSDGTPHALTGMTITGSQLTATRDSGDNPLSLSLPIGGAFQPIGSLWRATVASNGNFQDTGIPLPTNPDDDTLFFLAWNFSGASSSFNSITGAAIKALPTLAVGATSGGTVVARNTNGQVLEAAKTAAGTLMFTTPAGAWTTNDYAQLYEVVPPVDEAARGSGFSPQIISNQTYSWDGGTNAFNLFSGTSGTANLISPANGFLLLSFHGTGGLDGFEGNVVWQTAADLRAATATDPLHIRATGTTPFTAWNLYTNDDNEVLVSAGQSGSAGSLTVKIWHVTDDAIDPAGGYLWFNERNPDTTPAFSLTEVTTDGTQILRTGYTEDLLSDTTPPLTDGAPLTVDYEGAVLFEYDGSGNRVLELSVGFQMFPDDASKLVTDWRITQNVVQNGREISVAADAFSHVRMLKTGVDYITDGGGTYALTAADLAAGIPYKLILRIRMYNNSNQVAGSMSHLEWLQPQYVAYQIGVVGAQTTVVPAVHPLVSSFTLRGDKTPAAGSIAGDPYTYHLTVAQSSHASAVRIIGFAGTEQSPSAVAVLATIDQANWHEASGQITIPAGISLAAGESYTVRAEVYEAGQTPGTDEPTSYQDQRITAITTATRVRFIRVLSRIAGARPTAANLAANMAVISTSGTAAGDYTVSGIPNDSNDWLVGWIVPTTATQPMGYQSGGRDISHAISTAFDLTESGVDYKVYLFSDAAAADDTYNGTIIEVT